MPGEALTAYSKVQLEEFLQLHGISPTIVTAEYINKELQNPNSPLSKQFIALNIYFYLLWQNIITLTIHHQYKEQLEEALKQIQEDALKQDSTNTNATVKPKVMRTAEAYKAGDPLRKLDMQIEHVKLQLDKLKNEIVKTAQQQARELEAFLENETQEIVNILKDQQDAGSDPAIRQQLPEIINTIETLQTEFKQRKAQPKPSFVSANFEPDEVSTAMHNPLMQELQMVILIKRIPAPIYSQIAPTFKRNLDRMVERQYADMLALREAARRAAKEKLELEKQLQVLINKALSGNFIEKTADIASSKNVNFARR
jgi:hypothetical protein